MTEMFGDLDTERIRAVVTRRDSLNDLDAARKEAELPWPRSAGN